MMVMDGNVAAAGQTRAAGRVVGRLQQQRSAQDARPADARPASVRPVGVPAGAALDRHSRPPRPAEQASARPAGSRLGAAQHRSRVHTEAARHHRRMTAMCRRVYDKYSNSNISINNLRLVG